MKNIFIVVVALCSISFGASLNITGTVVSDGQKMIGVRYMGYVKKVFVKPGDRVKREDDLFEIESAEFDILKSQADLTLEQSQIVLDYWKKRAKVLERKRKNLNNKQGASLTDIQDLDEMVDNTSTMIESAKIMVREASVKAKQISSIYNYTKMKAPSDGVIVQKNIKVGDMIMPGMLAVVMVDTEDLEISADISERDYRYVRENQKVNIDIPAIELMTEGYIYSIVPNVNPMTHKIKIRIKFDRKNQRVLPGMYAKIDIDKFGF